MMLGLAAAMFAQVTIHIVAIYSADPFAGANSAIRLDPIRLVEAATAGVAFLAAGMIFLKQGTVHNLTTGAVMWLTASVGLAVGFGLWPLAVFAVLLDLLIVVVVRRIERGSQR
jgi:putative Mg2+ transporter-C (MgtC) family protein